MSDRDPAALAQPERLLQLTVHVLPLAAQLVAHAVPVLEHGAQQLEPEAGQAHDVEFLCARGLNEVLDVTRVQVEGDCSVRVLEANRAFRQEVQEYLVGE